MNEAETRAELIDPALAAAGWGEAYRRDMFQYHDEWNSRI